MTQSPNQANELASTESNSIKEILSWDGIAAEMDALAKKLQNQKFDLMLVVARGGLIPGAVLGYRLSARQILIAAVEYYDDQTGKPADAPRFLQFPQENQLRGKSVLIVDEVWDSGRTMEAVVNRLHAWGATPITAVLHYKPAKSVVSLKPDYFGRETSAWLVYPWSKHQGPGSE